LIDSVLKQESVDWKPQDRSLHNVTDDRQTWDRHSQSQPYPLQRLAEQQENCLTLVE